MTDLRQQMLRYLMAMSRQEQERIPPTRAGLVAWLGTEAGLAWLSASPIGTEVARRAMQFARDYASRRENEDHIGGTPV